MFDPYEKWLGIPKDQRPVDYFQLLGLDPKEKDPQAIRAAAQRRMDLLSNHKEGAHAQAGTRLLKEIRQAQTILLAPAQRKAYEAQLRKIAAERSTARRRTSPPRCVFPRSSDCAIDPPWRRVELPRCARCDLRGTVSSAIVGVVRTSR